MCSFLTSLPFAAFGACTPPALYSPQAHMCSSFTASMSHNNNSNIDNYNNNNNSLYAVICIFPGLYKFPPPLVTSLLLSLFFAFFAIFLSFLSFPIFVVLSKKKQLKIAYECIIIFIFNFWLNLNSCIRNKTPACFSLFLKVLLAEMAITIIMLAFSKHMRLTQFVHYLKCIKIRRLAFL